MCVCVCTLFSQFPTTLDITFDSVSFPCSHSRDVGPSDWDTMMQRRKAAMARRRKRRDVDITANDDHIIAMIRQMKHAAEVRSVWGGGGEVGRDKIGK